MIIILDFVDECFDFVYFFKMCFKYKVIIFRNFIVKINIVLNWNKCFEIFI